MGSLSQSHKELSPRAGSMERYTPQRSLRPRHGSNVSAQQHRDATDDTVHTHNGALLSREKEQRNAVCTRG